MLAWLEDVTPDGPVLAFDGLMLLAVLSTGGWLLFQLLPQNGTGSIFWATRIAPPR
jgi:hypothetical protein